MVANERTPRWEDSSYLTEKDLLMQNRNVEEMSGVMRAPFALFQYEPLNFTQMLSGLGVTSAIFFLRDLNYSCCRSQSSHLR